MLIDDFAVRYLPDDENRGLALRWRKKLDQFFLTNCVDINALFQAAGELLEKRVQVEPRPDSFMGRANAFVSADRTKVFVRQGLIDAAAKGDSQSIFDAVHELGHLILHRAEIPLARMAQGNEELEFLQPQERAEHQANVFARGFLMTDEEVALYPTPEALSENCCTPIDEAEIRLVEHCLQNCFKAGKSGSHALADPIAQARLRGYEGSACVDCRNFTLIRSGTCLVCETCGSMSRCT